MPPMPEPTIAPAKTPPKPKPKRGWFRRALRWALVVLLIAAIFHRPLFHGGARLALIAVAARMHLKADLQLSGNVFTHLTVEGVRAEPVGSFPNPIRKLTIDRVRLDYSIPRLVKHGIGEFLGSYEIINAEPGVKLIKTVFRNFTNDIPNGTGGSNGAGGGNLPPGPRRDH